MLKKIKYKEHPILGDLELDFSKSDGTLYNTIIFAGENGTGKTTILETLGTFLNLGSLEPFELIEYIVDDSLYTITRPSREEHTPFGFHIRTDSSGSATGIDSGKLHSRQSIDTDTLDIRYYGCVYSKARSGFNTAPVTSSTTQQLDDDKYDNDEKEDFTSIKQLIVDVSTQDNAAFTRLGKTNGAVTWAEFEPLSKIYRFRKAFNDFFDTIEFDGVDETSPDEKKIIFKKHTDYIPIDSLSTGEKQIVFRGAHLLRNSGNLNKGIILIDEPELSMHPKWQKKILEYYRGLFTVNSNQGVQILLATHSDYVLCAGLEDRDNVLIIVLDDTGRGIEAKRIVAPSALPTITSAETNYLAFGILSKDYHIELYGYLQSKTSNEIVKECDDYIAAHSEYDSTKHAKPDSYTNINGRTTLYKTLPTYIRNAINHPDSGRVYTENELQTSIELLIKLCK